MVKIKQYLLIGFSYLDDLKLSSSWKNIASENSSQLLLHGTCI